MESNLPARQGCFSWTARSVLEARPAPQSSGVPVSQGTGPRQHTPAATRCPQVWPELCDLSQRGLTDRSTC